MPKKTGRRTRPTPSEADVAHIAPELRAHAVLLGSLLRDPANLRSHPERSVAAIAASLRRFGQQKPVVADASGVVVAGNGMHEAAERLGWRFIAAVGTDLAGVDRAGFAIADNRIAELSVWDEPALRSVLAELPAEAAEAAGYTADELRVLLGDAEEVGDEGPPTPLAEAVSRRGDLWILGEHRLLCGDSTDAGDVARVMDGRKAALVATDPPYLVDYTGERANGTGKDWSADYREVDIADAEVFYQALFARVLEVLGEHAAIYCWHAHRRVGTIQAVWARLGILDHQQIVWVKPTSVFGSCMYHFQHEACLLGWRQGSRPRHDGRHDSTSVWALRSDVRTAVTLRGDSDVWAADWDGKARPVGNEHPTEKPAELFARPMRKHTAPGDVCFEPFCGSGSQLVAAERLGRRCAAIELAPVFADVGVRRWQKLTGRAATLVGDGRTWAQVAAERGVAASPADPDEAVAARGGSAGAPAAVPAAAPAKARGRRGRARDAV